MPSSHKISAGSATDNDVTLDDVQREAGDWWVITHITGGYKAVIREPEGMPIPRYGRTPAELLESIRHMETGREDMEHAHPSVQADSAQLAELSRLRAALPSYDVIITSHSPSYRYEAIRRHGETGPWCIISTDPADLWRELTAATRPQSGADTPTARAP